MQLNVGTIAACAPSLKPLVSKTLGLSTNDTHSYGNQYGSRGAARNITGASGIRTKTHDHYELHDLDEEETNKHQKSGHTSTTVAFYKGTSEGERSGSEEMILGDRPQNFKGIIRTTEVKVT